jgi:hypothetical protein
MPKILSIEVYQYDELSDEAKEKAREKLRDVNVEYDKWWDFVYGYWTEKLEAIGFEDIDIRFSGFWNQGDGASFTGNVDLVKYIRSQRMATRFRFLLDGIKKHGWCLETFITRSGNYVHECSTDISIDPHIASDLTDEQERRLGRQIEELEGCIRQHMIKLNKEIYCDLEKYYDGETSDEAIANTIVANEYEFWPSGKMFVHG